MMTRRLYLCAMVALGLIFGPVVGQTQGAPAKPKAPAVKSDGSIHVPDVVAPKGATEPRRTEPRVKPRPAQPERDPSMRVPDGPASDQAPPTAPPAAKTPDKPAAPGTKKPGQAQKPALQGPLLTGLWRNVTVFVKPRTIRLKTGEVVTHKGARRTIEARFSSDHKFRLIVRRDNRRPHNSRGVWERKGDIVRTRFDNQTEWTVTRILVLTAQRLKVKDEATGHVTEFKRVK